MLNIGVTGARGLLGRHLRAHLLEQPETRVHLIDRDDFSSPAKLARRVAQCDAIIHLAGMNRGEDAEIEQTNVGLAHALVTALRARGVTPRLLFSSSTHEERNTSYGRSKRRAAEVFRGWSQESGAAFTNLILPGVFGESGRPFYNSVVSTFAHQVASGEPPHVHADAEIEQVHAQDVARQMMDLVTQGHNGDQRVHGVLLTVKHLATLLQGAHDLALQGSVPRMDAEEGLYRGSLESAINHSAGDPFLVRLFNTYRSYLRPDELVVPHKLQGMDQNGTALLPDTALESKAWLRRLPPGATSIIEFRTGGLERCVILQGTVEVHLNSVLESRPMMPSHLTSDQYLDLPTFHVVTVRNPGPEPVTAVFWRSSAGAIPRHEISGI